MSLAAGLDVGGSSVKAWVAELDGTLLAEATVETVALRPDARTVEFEPAAWWEACVDAFAAAVHDARRAPGEYVGVTVSSLRQGFVLLDDAGCELGPGVLNADRRGAGALRRLVAAAGEERLYEVTGHWAAPELTLPKLLVLAEAEPERWAATRRVLFVADWVAWRLGAAPATTTTLASGGQLLDVVARRWADDLLVEVGLGTERLAELVEAGTVIGRTAEALGGLPAGLPVVAGGGDTQFAAAGCGGLADGAVTVVAGSTTPVQAATASPPVDPLRHPWVSTHLRSDRWAVETNAGYAGMLLDWLAAVTGRTVPELATLADAVAPGAAGVIAVVAAPTWSADAWTVRAPNGLVGMTPAHGVAEVARAFVEAHAFGIRSNLEDLERVMGRAADVILTGGAARDRRFCQLVADVTGRTVRVPGVAVSAAAAGAEVVARSLGEWRDDLIPPADAVRPSTTGAYDEAYARFLDAHAALRDRLPETYR